MSAVGKDRTINIPDILSRLVYPKKLLNTFIVARSKFVKNSDIMLPETQIIHFFKYQVTVLRRVGFGILLNS